MAKIKLGKIYETSCEAFVDKLVVFYRRDEEYLKYTPLGRDGEVEVAEKFALEYYKEHTPDDQYQTR